LNSSDFVAYDERFFDIVGPNAKVEHIQQLDIRSHEAPCLVPGTDLLFFVEWGPREEGYGQHGWQYLLDIRKNVLQTVITSPPTFNVHGCVTFNDSLYVVTDGSLNETGYLARIDPSNWKRTTLLNNYYEQPFGGFNDLAMDSEGNFYLTDSKSGWVCPH
jgi:gluconolactonase